MYDLMYMEDGNEYADTVKLITDKYPEAIIEDTSDFLHDHRFSADLVVGEEEWHKFLIKSKIALQSLHFQMLIAENPKEALRLIEECKKETAVEIVEETKE